VPRRGAPWRSSPDSEALSRCDLVFFATPNGVAMEQAPALLAAGVRVIDLAADFRLRDAALWARWYGRAHACPDLLEEAVYGLPEMNRSAIRTARLVANPGCYPTATQLALLPLLEAGVIEREGIVADCKSGVSGAGRKANVATLLCEASEDLKAYAVPGHRHLPEIRQGLAQIAGGAVGPGQPSADAQHAWCQLSVIDNLVKGAAGQAVQNMNIMWGWDERCGLEQPPLLP